MRHQVLLATAALAALAIAGCAGDRVTSVRPHAGQGMLAVHLTDAPLPLDSIKEVNVFVVRIDAKRAETDSAHLNDDLDHDERAEHDSAGAVNRDDDEGGEHADSTEWVTIATPNQTFNLLALQNGVTAFLGATPVDTGNFKTVRLIIDPAKSNVVLRDGTILTTTSTPAVEFEDKGRHALKVALENSVDVTEGATTTLTLDLKLNQSLTLRGRTFRDGFLFRPVVSGRTHRH